MKSSIPDLPYGFRIFYSTKRFDENKNIKTIIFAYNNETDAITCQKCFDLFYDIKCQSFFINENNFENYFLYENTKTETQKSILFCKKEFLKEKIIGPTSIQTKTFEKGSNFDIEKIESILIKNGYKRVNEVFCKNEYAIKRWHNRNLSKKH